MPELPEVETVRRGLAPALEGKTLDRVETRRADLRFPFPERFQARLEGRKVTALMRRAKYLLAHLDSRETLILHLGMTGRFTVEHGRKASLPGAYVYDTRADPRHDHVVFHIAGGGRVTYNDARRFGFMVLTSARELDDHPLMRGLGPEPLGTDFSPAYLSARAVGKKVNLKSFLMDQRIVAGLGNIYVSEALHRAGLSPDRAAATLAAKGATGAARAEGLVRAVQATLADAISAGGSTLRDYRHADGTRGGYQETFQVYDREGASCLRVGCGGSIRRIVHTGRASFYCPRCQR